ncbi:MAG: hypothetical protein QN199_12540 [Armatimonadota bacterium]|nr:hypothetical protein [Armatimonadota bacterium]
MPHSLDSLTRPHLQAHRTDRLLDPTALFEIRTPDGELVGRAVERCDRRWLRWLKYTRLRELTPLVLHVEAADGTPAFTLQREWDWLDRKPVRALRPSGAGLLMFQRFPRRWFGLWGQRLTAPDGRVLATLHTLQTWVFRDLHYQLRDPLGVPPRTSCGPPVSGHGPGTARSGSTGRRPCLLLASWLRSWSWASG